MRKNWIALLLLAVYALGQQQEVFMNWTVLRLWRGGSDENFIIGQIREHPEQYSFTPQDMQGLNGAGLPASIIEAMRAKHNNATVAAPAAFLRPASNVMAPASPAQTSPLQTAPLQTALIPPPPANLSTASPAAGRTELILQIRRGANWVTVLSEPMTWSVLSGTKKTVNSVLRVPTLGIVGRPIKAAIEGEHSRLLANNPPDFLLDVPAGSSTQNYLLVLMNPKQGMRTFVVGGDRRRAAHRSMPFYLTKLQTVGPWDQYKVDLPDSLQSGEYGIFDVRGVHGGQTQRSTGQTSFIYTFSVE